MQYRYRPVAAEESASANRITRLAG
jgi:hypothetical protein